MTTVRSNRINLKLLLRKDASWITQNETSLRCCWRWFLILRLPLNEMKGGAFYVLIYSCMPKGTLLCFTLHTHNPLLSLLEYVSNQYWCHTHKLVQPVERKIWIGTRVSWEAWLMKGSTKYGSQPWQGLVFCVVCDAGKLKTVHTSKMSLFYITFFNKTLVISCHSSFFVALLLSLRTYVFGIIIVRFNRMSNTKRLLKWGIRS